MNKPVDNNSVDNKSLGIMFSDIAGSTSIYDTLGDAAAERCIADALKLMRDIVRAHSGIVVKTIGDEIMARFDVPNDAYLAAREIQLRSANIKLDDVRSVQIRIGMHFGPVIEKEDDIFGDAVNIAARMAGIAKARQIMISEDFFLQLNQDNQSSSRLFDRAHVKGKEQALNIYQVVWEELDQTNIIVAQEGASISAAKGGLILVYNGQGSFISNADGVKAFTIGRDAMCDLRVESDFASRSHIEIIWKRDKFILTDHSTNGTQVTMESGEAIYLKRESYPLLGKGSFTLGVDQDHIISFEVLSSDQ